MTEPRTVVLVIDDTEVLREYVTEVLQETGRFQVIVAATGREGLGLLARADHPFAAVVLDCWMPGLDGIQVLERVQQARPDLPVIVVSADPGYQKAALDRGARTFVERVPGATCKICSRRSTQSSLVDNQRQARARDTLRPLPSNLDGLKQFRLQCIVSSADPRGSDFQPKTHPCNKPPISTDQPTGDDRGSLRPQPSRRAIPTEHRPRYASLRHRR